MNARLHTALEQAIGACRREAARIRRGIPEDDGDPEARLRTVDGLTESDAAEWDEDARLIEEHLAATGRPARVAEEWRTP